MKLSVALRTRFMGLGGSSLVVGLIACGMFACGPRSRHRILALYSLQPRCKSAAGSFLCKVSLRYHSMWWRMVRVFQVLEHTE